MPTSVFSTPASPRPLGNRVADLGTTQPNFLRQQSGAERRGNNDNAVTLSRSLNTKAPSASAAPKNIQDITLASDDKFTSIATNALRALAKTVVRYEETAKNLADAKKNGGDTKILETELAELSKQFSEITESDKFSDNRAYTQSALESTKSNLARGRTTEDTVKSLASKIGLLGSEFLNLVQSGDTANLEAYSQGLTKLSQIGLTGDTLKTAKSAIETSLKALGIIDRSATLAGELSEAEQNQSLSEATNNLKGLVEKFVKDGGALSEALESHSFAGGRAGLTELLRSSY